MRTLPRIRGRVTHRRLLTPPSTRRKPIRSVLSPLGIDRAGYEYAVVCRHKANRFGIAGAR
ncbi:hypothetical protein CKW46_13580 [Mycobacterium liflandii]|nr:hypothetical protein CKW46_13580 [Mycobacterium liflandii]